MDGVDLAREERLKKGEECIGLFKGVSEDPTVIKISGKPNEVSCKFLYNRNSLGS